MSDFGFLHAHSDHLGSIFGFNDMREEGDSQPLVLLARCLLYCEIGDLRGRLTCMLSFANDANDLKAPYRLFYVR
jgi:hypothetical protein